MVSFDVASVFTNISFDEKIEIIIRRIYDKKEINTYIPKQEMKELLYICTEKENFTLNEKTYIQVGVEAMGLPLGHV